ncbi:hypothetical protein ASC64_06630 [Nocardioides sp. Root122]|uniref:hypothetical protein n=1 Tax=Nocardioides TaxID=1839 RepID=UPI0007034A07|nr:MULTISPECIES: hypothetical protein [Nocardioides]KQV69516.1 hypothetical protein ASC64_06630 [Nocardioides sp. Root122]MCK9824295.1 hypothetical protein [Nocardioides cavernae]
MDLVEKRRRAHRFVALRVNVLGGWLVLTPVVLWSSVAGASAIPVAMFWAGTIGLRSADAWASARATGLSGRAAATLAGWWRAAAVLVLAVASTVLTATALRQLTVLGNWLGAPDVARPVVAALTIIVVGATVGIAAVVVLSRSPAVTGEASQQDELPQRQQEREGLRGGRRVAAVVVAAALGVVNVVVLASITPLGEWVADGGSGMILAVPVLALAFATPTAAVWYAGRMADAEQQG